MKLIDQDDLTSGVDHNVWRALVTSIENGSIETFFVLNRFVRNILQLSVNRKSLTQFQKYIFFPSRYYNVAFIKKVENSSLENIYKVCSSHAALNLKEIIWFDISISAKYSNDIETKKIHNQFYYWAFYGFSRLLYYAVKNNDFILFLNSLDEFDQITDISYGKNHDIKTKIRNLTRANSDGSKNDEIKQLKEEYFVSKQFETLSRHTLLGIKYWIIFLYKVGQLNEETTNDLIKSIRVDYTDPEDVLNDIIFFRGNDAFHYMGWRDFDHLDRKPMKPYSPPDPSDWLTFGFLIDQIRDNRLIINIDDLEVEDIENVRFLYNSLKESIENLDSGFSKWANVLMINDISTFRNKTTNILSLFAALKRKSLGVTEKEIASTPLSQALINEFKQNVGRAWRSKSVITRLFRERGNREEVTDDKVKLRQIGQRTFFERAKMMFIEGPHHQTIYGIDRMGAQIGRWEDTEFFSTVLQSGTSKITSNSITQLLNKAIAELKSRDIMPNLILLAPEYSYKDKELINSNLYKPRIDYQEDDEDLSFFEIGSFDGVPIYSSFSELLKNSALICNFENSFKMRYRTNPAWYEKELTVNVQEVSNEEAQRRLNQQPDKWSFTEDGVYLKEDDAITLIKTSVCIDLWSTNDFLLLDKESFIFGSIRTEIKSE